VLALQMQGARCAIQWIATPINHPTCLQMAHVSARRCLLALPEDKCSCRERESVSGLKRQDLGSNSRAEDVFEGYGWHSTHTLSRVLGPTPR
jgi:hypothetical protein